MSEPSPEHERQRRWTEGPGLSQSLRKGPKLLKEKRYVFDRAFDATADTQTVYQQSVKVSVSRCSLPALNCMMTSINYLQISWLGEIIAIAWRLKCLVLFRRTWSACLALEHYSQIVPQFCISNATSSYISKTSRSQLFFAVALLVLQGY